MEIPMKTGIFVGKIIYKRVFLSSAIFDDRVLALKSER